MVGRADIAEALQTLDKLTQEEARMAAAQTLNTAHGVDEKVTLVGNELQCVSDKLRGVDDRVKEVGENVIHGA